MAVAKPDFTRQFGSAKTDLTPISSSNYLQGWDYVGSTPPTKNDFTYLQNLADQRIIWLFENYGVGRIKSFQRLTGTGNYIKPAGINFIRIRAQAGGGGGGGAGTTSSGQAAASGGGSGGFYGETSLIDVTNVSTIPYVVGLGGSAGTAGNSGGGGGLTSFGGYISVPGGSGGIPGFAVGLPQLYPDLGSFGSASGSALILTVAGGMGRGGVVVATTAAGCLGGKGGDSMFGRGAQTSDGAGSPGGVLSNGGGGSGAAVGPNSTTGKPGSAGGSGLIIVEEYV